MKKTLLASAIALSMLSTGAYATCGGGCGSALPAAGSATVGVSGSASTYTENGVGGTSSVEMSSWAKSGSIAASGSHGGAAEFCGNGVGAIGGAAIAGGYAITGATGHVTGGAQGYNLAEAGYTANTQTHFGGEKGNFAGDVSANASVSGNSWSEVLGSGYALNGTASAAGSAAGGVGSNEYSTSTYTEYHPWWGWAGKRTVTKEQTEGAEMKLGSISGAGSISGGVVSGGGAGSAGSTASAESDVTGSVESYHGNASVSGTVGSDSFASSAATPDANDYAVSGAGSYNGAVAGGKAYSVRSVEKGYRHWLDHGRVNGSSEYNTAEASDKKFGAADSFVTHVPGPGNGAEAGGNSNVDITATAGDETETR